MQIAKLVENYLSTFQQCLLSQDPIEHAKSLNDSVQKNLLLFLLQPHSNQFRQILKTKYSINGPLLDVIDKWKMHTKIINATTPEDIKYIIDKFVKEHSQSYNFAKPAQFHSNTEDGKIDEGQALPNALKPLKPLNQWVQQQLQKNEQILPRLSKQAILSISQQRLLNLTLNSKQQFLIKNYIIQFSDQFGAQFFKKFYEQQQTLNKNYQLPNSYLQKLSKNQFMLLKDLIPGIINKDEYLRLWFAYNYDQLTNSFEKTDLTISEKDQKRKVILSILKDLQLFKTTKIKSMRRSLLKQLLTLDISRQDVDKNIFIEYIQDNPTSSKFENQNFKQRKLQAKSISKKKSYKKEIFHDDDDEMEMDMFIQQTYTTGDEQNIKKCIQNLFKKQNAEQTLKQLQQYYDISFLNKIYATVKLSQGGKLQDYKNYLSNQQIKTLKQQKQLTILQSNKRRWKVDDAIALKIRVKNIKDIHVHVYNLDLQKHFTQGNGQIDQTQNLSFLQPNKQHHFITNSENPYLVGIYDVKIQGIPESQGVWVVELQGEGISSRAFIRKGAIASVTSTNSTGTQVKFYDENGQKVKNYSLWMDGKKHNAQSNFTIPYGQSDKNVSLILIKDGYADKFNVYVPRQSYALDIGYIYNTESFIVGAKSKIILHPRLSLAFDRSMQVSFKLLQKVRIVVNLTNNLGIKSTIDFDNIQFKSNQDYLLQFPVQSYPNKIQISVTAKIKKYNQKEQVLNSSHNISINLGQASTNFIDVYIRKSENGYNLFLLGKNGERIPRTEAIVDVLGRGRSQVQSQNLMTSKQGIIQLGNLDSIEQLTARVNLKNNVVTRSWNFKQGTDSKICSKYYKEGQDIVFPPVKKQKCSLWKVSQTSRIYMQNLSDRVVFDDQKLLIKGLKVGFYTFQLSQNGQTYSFNIINGKAWDQNKIYDQTKGMLYQLQTNQNNNFILGDASIKQQGQNTIIEIPVKATYDINSDNSFRANLFATNFVVPSFINEPKIQNMVAPRPSKTQAFNTKQSQYYNNKNLSEQSSYVINRKNQTNYIGNNLQKPRMFLKRLEVRDTNQSQEQLAGEIAYQQNKQFHGDMYECKQANIALSKASHFSSYDNLYNRRFSSSMIPTNPLQITSHNNFIGLPATLISNQTGNFLKFVVPNGYSHFECYAFSNSVSALKKYNYFASKLQIKNIRHSGIQKSSKDSAWTMSRQVYKVQKGENAKVNRDSFWSAVGLNNIVNFAKIKGANLQDWVLNWCSYSTQQKLKTYDQKVCHQLNAYIKYNDPQFFQQIVRPFINNKVNKTFVDYCLLQSQEAFKWYTMTLFKTLNQFQKVLLVHQLVKTNQKEQAQNIVKSMENGNKANRITFEQFKKQFDTVLTAKQVQEAKNAQFPGSKSRSSGSAMKSAVSSIKLAKRMVSKQKKQQSRSMDKRKKKRAVQCDEEQDDQVQCRKQYNQPFKQMQKTKQYTQTTYSKLKYPHQSQNLVNASPFWTSAAQHFINGKGDFVSQNFMYLTTAVEFTLASCFIPNQKLLQYDLKNNEGDNSVSIGANSSFLIFVREVKSLPFEKKFGVLLNQRFFNPDDRYYYEDDGTRIEKQVEQFIVRRPYCLQTLITNTSGTRLQLQLLIDIPEGSVPLKSHENTQIQSTNLEPYSTLSFERYFYFPSVGGYNMYPANACRGSSVIAKAQQLNNITVLQAQTIKKLDTLQNILKSGQKQAILQYLRNKNIFDSKIFDPTNIFWMLKDKQFYLKAIQVLRSRKYYLPQIWMFGYYHNDIKSIAQFQKTENQTTRLIDFPVFQYFPYYSSRAHKFLNENKSTIRNQQFKKTYFNFLFASLFSQPTSSRSRIAFIYYLLLQDRVDQAFDLLSKIDETVKQAHRIQFDYIQCFIDMYKGYPSFSKSRTISKKYNDYPVSTWQKLFKQITDTLKQYDSVQISQQKKKVEYSTTVLNEGTQIKINIPADTRVQVCFYDVNLQLYFSNFPFNDLKDFSSNIIPNNSKFYEACGQSRQQRIVRDKGMKDCFIQIYSSTSDLKRKKITSFLWTNPNIKIKAKQDAGYAQVYYENKKQAGCYCKVYQMKNGQSKFYRDGYTDITGSFKYALADLQGVTQFSIIFVTDYGGVIQRVKPPSQQAYLS